MFGLSLITGERNSAYDGHEEIANHVRRRHLATTAMWRVLDLLMPLQRH